MSVSDFIACRRVLHDGAGRYVVRRPTFATVHRFLELYGVEVIAMNEAEKMHPGCLSLDSAFKVVLCDDRMRLVLETCVESDAVQWPLETLARAAVGMADIPRIFDSLSLPGMEEAGAGSEVVQEGPTDQEISLVALAQKFGVPPHTVADWPYETFLGALECVNVMTATPEGQPNETDFEKLCRLQAEGKLH